MRRPPLWWKGEEDQVILCPECGGQGSVLEWDRKRSQMILLTCFRCGGDGFITKPEKEVQDEHSEETR